MREIKFRAWDSRKKEYHKRDNMKPIASSEDGVVILDALTMKFRDTSLHLEQFTGLKDKNGVEIYEGDILRSKKNIFIDDGFSEQIVRFSEGCFVVDKVNLNILLPDFSPEVIGNIHGETT